MRERGSAHPSLPASTAGEQAILEQFYPPTAAAGVRSLETRCLFKGCEPRKNRSPFAGCTALLSLDRNVCAVCGDDDARTAFIFPLLLLLTSWVWVLISMHRQVLRMKSKTMNEEERERRAKIHLQRLPTMRKVKRSRGLRRRVIAWLSWDERGRCRHLKRGTPFKADCE